MVRRLPVFNLILKAERDAVRRLCEGMDFSEGPGLDIGTGSGDSLSALPAMKRVVLDASFEMLTRTPVFIKVVGVGEHLPFHSHRFSFVSAVGLMEYVRQPEQVLAETVRVSRPPARLLVTSSPVTVVNSFRRVFGAKLYLRADEEVAQLLECAGLEILRSSKTLMQSQWLVRIAGDRRVVNAKN